MRYISILPFKNLDLKIWPAILLWFYGMCFGAFSLHSFSAHSLSSKVSGAITMVGLNAAYKRDWAWLSDATSRTSRSQFVLPSSPQNKDFLKMQPRIWFDFRANCLLIAGFERAATVVNFSFYSVHSVKFSPDFCLISIFCKIQWLVFLYSV